jgi:hypothetical protein
MNRRQSNPVPAVTLAQTLKEKSMTHLHFGLKIPRIRGFRRERALPSPHSTVLFLFQILHDSLQPARFRVI